MSNESAPTLAPAATLAAARGVKNQEFVNCIFVKISAPLSFLINRPGAAISHKRGFDVGISFVPYRPRIRMTSSVFRIR